MSSFPHRRRLLSNKINMIVRDRRKIDRNCRELSFHVSFTGADVKEWLRNFYCIHRQQPFTQEYFTNFLQESHLRGFQEKYSEEIARWAWCYALNEKFVTDNGQWGGSMAFLEHFILPEKIKRKRKRKNR